MDFVIFVIFYFLFCYVILSKIYFFFGLVFFKGLDLDLYVFFCFCWFIKGNLVLWREERF